MALTYSKPEGLGTFAPDFDLLGVDGQRYSLASFRDARALTVVFMCNHCPYVIAVHERLNALAKEHKAAGAALVGINSNDEVEYPDDSYPNMVETAREWGLVFPYLHDPSQAVARAYDAACTPDPFLYENLGQGRFALRYHGRIDDNWKDPTKVNVRELSSALADVLAKRPVQTAQKPSMGCNIKWR